MKEFPELPDGLQRWLSGLAKTGESERETFRRLAFLSRRDLEEEIGVYLRADSLRRQEVVLGSGLHACIYAINRQDNLRCLDKDPRPGGIFARAERPVFYLNSRNRPEQEYRAPGSAGPLNSIIGGFLQPSELSMREYQDQSDFALAIRTNLLANARVQSNARALSVTPARLKIGTPYRLDYELNGERQISYFKRIVAATGFAEPRMSLKVQGRRERILTFNDFLERMGDRGNIRPLQGFKRVAIVGAKDSGKVVAEYLLGLGPQPGLSTAAEDFVERITWIGQTNLTKEEWEDCERSRYAGLGRSFPRSGQLNYYYRVQPEPGRALRAVGGSQTVRVDWMGAQGPRSEKFDYVVLCTGFENQVDRIFEKFEGGTEEILINGRPVARKYIGEEIYIIGPAAELTPTPQEVGRAELDKIDENIAAAFRYSERTAAFARMPRDIPRKGPLLPLKSKT